MDKDTGQIAYDAYAAASGTALPAWSDLPPAIAEAWRRAVKAAHWQAKRLEKTK